MSQSGHGGGSYVPPAPTWHGHSHRHTPVLSARGPVPAGSPHAGALVNPSSRVVNACPLFGPFNYARAVLEVARNYPSGVEYRFHD